MTDRDRLVAALLHELAGYETYGRADRAQQVRDQLAELGHVVSPGGDQAPPAEGAVEEAGGGSARRRSGRRA